MSEDYEFGIEEQEDNRPKQIRSDYKRAMTRLSKVQRDLGKVQEQQVGLMFSQAGYPAALGRLYLKSTSPEEPVTADSIKAWLVEYEYIREDKP